MVVLGNESSVIYYNLNKQFSNIKKVILTKEIILTSFEDNKIRELFSNLQAGDSEHYFDILKQAKETDVFDSLLKNELYKQIQDSIKKISDGVMDVQLKDYNFMSTVSNAKFTVTLRTDNFSLSHYYQEKGAILSAIRSLIKEYLEFSGNLYRLNKLENFQIEIYETEEIYKSITLKKEGSSLLLSSAFGFSKSKPMDYIPGNEFYFSIGEDFKFFENSQTTAVLRDHAKLAIQEINPQEKILTNEDLVLINNNTKNINDAVIEMYLDKKGHLRILNLSLLENSIYTNSDDGFVINKSSKNYNKVSLITLRDNLEDELPNPKYLIIRNDQEIEQLLQDLSILSQIDGLIFNSNFYAVVLDKLGQALDIDILFYKNPLQKSLEVSIDLENFSIEGAFTSRSAANPFSNIIDDGKKEKDEFLEKLKNIDLSTPQTKEPFNPEVENLAQGIISSPNASTSNQRGNSNMNWPSNSTPSQGKKSAIAMLADSVMNAPSPQEKAEPQQPAQPPEAPTQKPLDSFGDFSKSELVMDNVKSQDVQPTSNDPFADLEKYSNEPQQSTQPSLEQPAQSMMPQPTLQPQIQIPQDVSKYEGILATKILSPPSVPSSYHFADMNSISEVQGGEIYLLVTDKSNMGNKNLKYVLPIASNSPDVKNCYLLIDSLEEYFLIDPAQDVDYFLNISNVPANLKENFLKTCYNSLPKFSLIANKSDVSLIENYISKIEAVYVKDVQTDPELLQVEKQILAFEKRVLIKG